MNFKFRLQIAGLILLILVSGYFLFFWRQKIFPTAGMKFHPDSVKVLKWDIQDQAFEFQRQSRTQKWKSSNLDLNFEQESVQVVLNSLSIPELLPMKIHKGDLRIELVFEENNRWVGFYNGSSFVWAEGLMKGWGLEKNHPSLGVLAQGKYAFSPKKVNWCAQRPIEIEVDFKTEESKEKLRHQFKIESQGLDWILNNQSKIDPSSFEKWLSTSCDIAVDYFLDPNFENNWDLIEDGYFQVRFQDSKVTRMSWSDSYWKIKNLPAFSSKKWEKALQDLEKIPAVTEK